VTIITYLCSLLLTGVLTGWTGFHPTWLHGWTRHEPTVHHERHERHHGRTKVVVATNEHGHGTLQVRSRHGATHVRLGSGHHGLEVWTDEGGKNRVDLGGALKVETDEQGGSKVRVGDLVVNSD
jgi:hypothetical protein